jgi:ABC-type transporter Mla subunit MlaD
LPLAAAVDSAERAAEELKSLEEFSREEQDPEIEKLVNELKQAIEALKQPGIEPREALAKISQMQSAVEQQQSKFNVGQIDAQLQAIGQALALSSAMAEAGNALSSKHFEKAVEELEKLEAPEQLDRQTEKAIKEKLDALARQMQDSGTSSIGAVAGELSKGLGGDGKRFKRGLVRLAKMTRDQVKRKKLNDLLKRQNDQLAECKCLDWGKAASGNVLGEETPKFGGHYETRLTGRQSDQGEIEVETTHAPEGKQQAQREYRETYDKYRKISEAVLDSEPIPLGHRQTIRRYFEAIRPTDAETDATQAATK